VRELGTILSVTPTGHLTVRSNGPEYPSEGTPVRDSRGIVRGRVVRVFGPVSRPYLSVRPRRLPTPAEGLSVLGGTLVRE
jgi:rRNA processing protein Gar1